MLRYLAPAGSPITVSDLLRWAGTAVTPGDAERRLTQAVSARVGGVHATATSTGRAGMTLLLRAMRRLAATSRTEVVLPSYTCYSVAASIVKAGLKPRVVDISPRTLDYAPDALATVDFSRVLAVIATNLYGIPNDLPTLLSLTRAHGAFLIDDAAQAMGASIGGRASGTWGDAGLYSFDKGKNVSAIDGGVVLTQTDALAAALDAEMQECRRPPATTSAVHVAKAVAYSVLLRPWLYGIPARIPQLGLGRTVFTTDYPLDRPDPALMALAVTMLPRLEAFTAARQANAAALLNELRRLGVESVTPSTGSVAAYLRLPILVADARQQAAVIADMHAAGIGATTSYPASLADVPDLQPYLANPNPPAAGGRDVAARIVTLPTHPFVTPADIRRMAQVLAGRGGAPADHRVQPA